MKKYSLLALVFSIVFLCSCVDVFNTPPDLSVIQAKFDENKDDIELVISSAEFSQYDDLYFSEPNGEALSGLRRIPIQNTEVCEAINRLLKKGNYENINKKGEGVCLLQWSGMDIGCGIIFSDNIEKSIDDFWLTEVKPMSDDGWYYYVSNYNDWRVGRKASVDEK